MLTKLGSTFYVMRVRISSLKREGGGVNCLRGIFENFFRFNEILCINPKLELS